MRINPVPIKMTCRVMKYWIGFNNFSRSTATHAPQVGNWDDKGSQVWVNDILVLPPKWANAGIKANLLESESCGFSCCDPVKRILLPVKRA